MISIIIPTMNEEDNIEKCIGSIIAEGADCEIIVADGGSADGTAKAAGKFKGVNIVETKRGRGTQMNSGARSAKGEILLFLHADTVLEKGWGDDLISALEDRSIAGGAFTFRIDSNEKKYRLIEKWVKLRCGLLGLPYGDQGIFVRADIFEKLGGYIDMPLMEDVDIIERMRKKGRIIILDKKVFIDDRRWAKKGWIRASVLNQLIMVMYRAGVSPERLARIYYG